MARSQIWRLPALGFAVVLLSVAACAHGGSEALDLAEADDPNSILNNNRPAAQYASEGTYEQQLRAAEVENPDSVDSRLPPPSAVLQRLHALDQGEIAAGRLAQHKGGAYAAAFGSKLSNEHQAAEQRIAALASKLYVELDDPSDQRARRKLLEDQEFVERLKLAQGPQFDRLFARQMESDQHKDFDAVLSLRNRCVEPELCALLDQMLHLLQKDAAAADSMSAAVAEGSANQ